jgi:23S rRNA pseudouridine955/2504/2580 synthase
MRRGLVKKQYLAILEGRIDTDQVWEDELVRDTGKKKTFTLKSGGEKIAGGAKPKAARTGIHPLGFAPGKDKAGGYSLVIAEIETGRTHQIRAQAASRGHPLGGDIKYGGRPFPGQKPREGGFFLHAWKITLCETGGEQGTLPEAFTAPPPVAFNKQVKHLFGEERKLFGN